MKRTLAIALAAVLCLGLMTGCRSREENTDTTPKESTMDLLPDEADTIDPSSGANREPASSEPSDVMPSEVMPSEVMPSDTAPSEPAPTDESTEPRSRMIPRN